jgi:hypothetical protein
VSEQVIYSVLQNGSDSVAIAGLVPYVLFAGVVGYLALRFRALQRKGVPLAGGSARTLLARTFLATHAVAIVVLMSLVGIAYACLAVGRSRADRELLASGDYQSISGSLDDDRAAEIGKPGRQTFFDVAAGYQRPVDESDQLTVGQHTFIVRCQITPEKRAASVGDGGRCFDLRIGQQIKIDFERYRAEPLRITVR